MTVQLIAEIDAGPLDNDGSVFSLVEKGLHRNRHAPAAICLHEPADQLHDLHLTDNHQQSDQSGGETKYLSLLPNCIGRH